MSQKELQRVKVMENAAGGRLSVREASRLLQLSGGRIVGLRLARVVLPDPGGPVIRMFVTSGAGDLEGALRGLLFANVFEIDEKLLRFTEERIGVCLHGRDAVAGVDEVNHIPAAASPDRHRLRRPWRPFWHWSPVPPCGESCVRVLPEQSEGP